MLVQVKMLQAIGMKSTLVADGNSPNNLFSKAKRLFGGMVAKRGGGGRPGKVESDDDDDEESDDDEE
jgi:hypothetical protein